MNRFCFSMFAFILLEFVNLGVAMGEGATDKTVVSESRASQAVEGKSSEDVDLNDDSNRLISTAAKSTLSRSKFESLKPFIVTPNAEPKALPKSSTGKVWREFKEFVNGGVSWLTSGHNLYWSVCAILVFGYLGNKMRL